MKKETVIEVVTTLYIILFVYAATSKLMDYEKFKVQLSQSPLLTAFAGWVAWGIPAIEILISVMLIIPKTRLVGLYAAYGLMIIFTAYIVAITQFADYVPCSCGGVLQKLGWTEHLIFNVGFVILGFLGVHLETKVRDEKLQYSSSL